MMSVEQDIGTLFRRDQQSVPGAHLFRSKTAKLLGPSPKTTNDRLKQ
jgi:hypothetical protein